MKRTVAGFVIVSMLAGAPAAFADRNHGDGWNGQRHGQGWKGHGERRHYAQTYRYSGRRHHENNDNRNDAALYALGGLFLGGLITHAIQQSRNTAVTTTYAQPSYAQPNPSVSSGGRRLFRDLDGRCYDLATDARGYELRSELPSSACNW